MSAAEKTTDEAGEPSWDLAFSAVELKESASLGGDVRLELSPRTTVLVGKNGAGKSLLLERIGAGTLAAAGGIQTVVPDPAHFACDVEVRPLHPAENSFKLRYECHWSARNERQENAEMSALTTGGGADLVVRESCLVRGEADHLLWSVDDGVVLNDKAEHGEIPTGWTLLRWTIGLRGRAALSFPAMTAPLRKLFIEVSRAPLGVPRGDSEREQLTFPYPETNRARDTRETRKIHRLAYILVHWHEEYRERFDEFVALGRRIGLLDEVKVKLYRDPDAHRTAQSRDLASVIFDGTNLGLLSDGTLRVAELLLWLLFPEVKLLLIEEPETAVHPGLLSRLLAEIDAYSTDRQIVLTTQSPQVVSWADPHALRLVERQAGKTSVRSLREDEIGRVSAYLNDEGTLGDFVYSGALDG